MLTIYGFQLDELAYFNNNYNIRCEVKKFNFKFQREYNNLPISCQQIINQLINFFRHSSMASAFTVFHILAAAEAALRASKLIDVGSHTERNLLD